MPFTPTRGFTQHVPYMCTEYGVIVHTCWDFDAANAYRSEAKLVDPICGTSTGTLNIAEFLACHSVVLLAESRSL